jgi:hypothetical protein
MSAVILECKEPVKIIQLGSSDVMDASNSGIVRFFYGAPSNAWSKRRQRIVMTSHEVWRLKTGRDLKRNACVAYIVGPQLTYVVVTDRANLKYFAATKQLEYDPNFIVSYPTSELELDNYYRYSRAKV